MSRIGKTPIVIPEGVAVQTDGVHVSASGPVGELSLDLAGGVLANVKDGQVEVTRPDDTQASKSLHGLGRSLIANMIQGVAKEFEKSLQIEGMGFKAELQDAKLVLALGFASPVEYAVPEGIKIDVVKGVTINIKGPDKQQVGDVAAIIRSFYPPEPYKGKGVRYVGEHVRRKAGKTVA